MIQDLLKTTLNKANSTLRFQIKTASALKQLGIVAKDQDDYEELNFLIKTIFSYPSTELAHRHHDSNRMGIQDLVDTHPDKFSLQELSQVGHKIRFCPCCGFMLQPSTIKLCTDIDDIKNLGISTYLYFEILSAVIKLFIVLFLIYSIFSVSTNLVASNQSIELENQNVGLLSQVAFSISLVSKQINATNQNMNTFTIQTWLGVGFICSWILLLAYIKGREQMKIRGIRLNREQIDDQDTWDSLSAADLSIQLNEVPISIDKQQMQNFFDDYHQTLLQRYPDSQSLKRTNLKIQKFNVGKPFYLHQQKFDDNPELKKINKQYQQYLQLFKSWIQQRKKGKYFSQPFRAEYYQKFKAIQAQRLQLYTQITNQILQQFQNSSSKQATNTVFITFQNSIDKEILLDYNEFQLRSSLRDFFLCCRKSNRLLLQNSNGKKVPVKVYPAPEPQDIIWMNLGHSKGQRNKRRLITYFMTLVILALSFFTVYALTVLQKKIIKKHDQYLSLGISLILSIFNLVIQMIIRYLTIYQRQQSQTNHQTSLAVKSVLALLINSIVIPILANYIVGNSFHDQNGLIYDVFLLGLTNSFLSPILKIFDPYYLMTRLLKKWKDKAKNKISMNQKQLNQYYEGIPFEAGFQYIYIVNLYLFVCFYVPLQPILPLFAIIALFMMHWAQKFSILNFCKRPVPGNTTIHRVMFQFIYLGPLFYTVGNYIWKSYFPLALSTMIKTSTIVSLVLSLLILILPFDVIFNFIFKDSDADNNLNYYEARIYFPSEYDRLNPITSKSAIEEYMKYVEQFKKNLQDKRPSDFRKLQKNFLKQIIRGQQQQNTVIKQQKGSGNMAQKRNINAIQQIFSTQSNIISPIIVGAQLLPFSQKLKPDLEQEPTDQFTTNLHEKHKSQLNIKEILLNRLSNSSKQNKHNRMSVENLFRQNRDENILDPKTNFSNIFEFVKDNKNLGNK